MENWFLEQTNCMIDNWSKAISKFYPENALEWNDPCEHIKALSERWNTLNAVKYVNWGEFINKTDMKVLDLGCGTGWLSAFLSRFDDISQIDALDSDKHNLDFMLPEIVKLMEGNHKKIRPILSLFYPLLCENSCYDLIVSSSSAHHADNLFYLFKELKRVLKNDGKLIILNETPCSWGYYFGVLCKNILKILFKSLKKESDEFERCISAAGILDDPYLGDHMYNFYQWDNVIKKAGFKYEIVKSPYFPYKNVKKQPIRLTHFICY